MKLSVLISTRNRPHKIGNCLKSILANSFSDFEIIVVDQSSDHKTKKVVKKISSPLIRYFKMKEKGLSRSRNLGVKKAREGIIAFTDDDCLVDKYWLKNIYLSFQKNKEVSAVFGKVLPYRPKEHLGLCCASFTKFKKEKIFTSPRKNKRFVFSGNSLSFRRSVFDRTGFFKEWLGVGSIGMATEDEEFIYRLLKKGGKVLLNPQVLVYHNRWITDKEFHSLPVKYACGFFSAFGYYAFKGDKIAQDYIAVFSKEKFREWKQEIKFCIKDFHPRYLFRLLLVGIPFEIYYYIKGILIAFYFANIKKE